MLKILRLKNFIIDANNVANNLLTLNFLTTTHQRFIMRFAITFTSNKLISLYPKNLTGIRGKLLSIKNRRQN